MIQITINGQPQFISKNESLLELLEKLNIEPKTVVVEINYEALAPSEFENIILRNEDKLEIVRATAGG